MAPIAMRTIVEFLKKRQYHLEEVRIVLNSREDEALERLAPKEALRRVHECVFGVLALESEPVDPRLSPTFFSKLEEPERTEALNAYNSALIRGRDDWLEFSLKCAIHKVKLILIFDPFEGRAADPMDLCRNALPNHWPGRIEYFKETYDDWFDSNGRLQMPA